MIKRPLGRRVRSFRVLIKQGHLLKRAQTKFLHFANWAYSAIRMSSIRSTDATALLYGKNDDEENLLASALALTLDYRGEIVYLANDIERTRNFIATLAPSVPGSQPEKIDVGAKTKKSIRRLHVRCQLVITSHILISAPKAKGKRVHVHVSHGLGPKTYRNIRSSETALTSNTTVWNSQHLRAMVKPAETTILQGYPRQEILIAAQPARDDCLARLGISAAAPFVIWAPTVRSANFGSKGRWTEGVALHANDRPGTWGLVHDLQCAARKVGVQLIAKPHPVEADAMRNMGLHVITNDDLWGAGISPYQFIGLSDGLISDYSSIWIDYFAVNRSVGLYCPDIQVFQNGIRGLLEPPFRALADGLFIESFEDFVTFFECAKRRQIYNHTAYERVRKEIGYVETDARRTQLFIDGLRRVAALQGVDLAFRSSPI